MIVKPPQPPPQPDRVLEEVAAERAVQDARWGEQNHPDGTGPDIRLHDGGRWNSRYIADLYRSWCNSAAARGKLTWKDILTEEVFEAFAEDDPARLRAELLQVAAVAAAWAQAIDRRQAPTPPPTEDAH